MAVYEVAGSENILRTAISSIRGGKNTFVIDTDNDLFYIPYTKKFFSKLSDIDNVTFSSEEHTGLIDKDLHIAHNLKITGILFGEKTFNFGKRKDACEQLRLILERVIEEIKNDEKNKKEAIKKSLFDKPNTKMGVYEVAGNENISNIFSALGTKRFEGFRNVILSILIVAFFWKSLQLQRPLFLLAMTILVIYCAKRIIEIVIGIVNGNKNIFTIDVDNDLFYMPYSQRVFCKLSDIDNVVFLPEKASDFLSSFSKPYIAYNLKIIGSTFGEKTLYFGKLKDACSELQLVLEVVIEERQEEERKKKASQAGLTALSSTQP